MRSTEDDFKYCSPGERNQHLTGRVQIQLSKSQTGALSFWELCTRLILPTNQWDGYYSLFHFIEDESEVQKGHAKGVGWDVSPASPALGPRLSSLILGPFSSHTRCLFCALPSAKCLHWLTHSHTWTPLTTPGPGAIRILTLQMKNWVPEMVRAFAAGTLVLDGQGHIAGKWQGQGENSFCCVLLSEVRLL